jgi:hypothetical protein
MFLYSVVYWYRSHLTNDNSVYGIWDQWRRGLAGIVTLGIKYYISTRIALASWIRRNSEGKFAPSFKRPVMRKQRQGWFRGKVRLPFCVILKISRSAIKKVKPLALKVFFCYDCTLCIESIQTSRCGCKTPVVDVSIFCLENYIFGSLDVLYESNGYPCQYQAVFSGNQRKNTELRNSTIQSSGVDRNDTGEVKFSPLILLVMLLFFYGQEMLCPKMQVYPLLATDYCLFFERSCRS